jgi:hypothetical protein
MHLLVLIGAVVIAVGLGPAAPAGAAESLALDGNEYKVTLSCENDAGSYCDDEAKDETFQFNSNGNFVIKSLDVDLDLRDGTSGWLHDYFGEEEELGGTFSEDGFTFSAAYNNLDQDYNYYKITIEGWRFFRLLIFGSMNIKYYEPVWKSLIIFDYVDRWELTDETDARFYGIRD